MRNNASRQLAETGHCHCIGEALKVLRITNKEFHHTAHDLQQNHNFRLDNCCWATEHPSQTQRQQAPAVRRRGEMCSYWTGMGQSIPATWLGLRPPEHVRSEAVKSMIRVAARQGDWCIYSAEMWMGAAECRH